MNKEICIGKKILGVGHRTYVIAEVGSNFDGNLERAKELAWRCKKAGADAYKIQNFLAPKIVSIEGFRDLQLAFQAKWEKPVVDVYRSAEFPREWVKELAEYCRSIDIDFFSSPYDREAVDLLEEIGVVAHKIGSGEIDNLEFLKKVAKSGKPVIVGVGAATLAEIKTAVAAVRATGNNKLVLLQCVTNYPSPIADANVRAMVEIGKECDALYGYSDHTIGPQAGGDDPLDGLTIPLAAAALGACIIEKHVTDDPGRKGPDHPFAMTIDGNFTKMICSIRAMEKALGDGKKRLMDSEREAVVIQRRGIYAKCSIKAGETFTAPALEYLRPAVGLRLSEIATLIGKRAARDIPAGAPITRKDFL